MHKSLWALFAAAAFAAASASAVTPSAAVFTAYWNTQETASGFGLGAKGRFSWFELRATYYNDLNANPRLADRNFQVSVFPVEAGLIVDLPADWPFKPYAGGGAGYYFMDTDLGHVNSQLGWYAVAGGEFGADANVSFLLEVIYRRLNTTVSFHRVTTDFQDETDLVLSGPGLNAALQWRY